MRKAIWEAPCLLLSLLTSFKLCCGKFGTPITDDVSNLSLLAQNIPSDYQIPLTEIPREVAGSCWVVLNVFPLEQSLQRLAGMFGEASENQENILVFVAMLKSLRFTLDHEDVEAAMQLFRCHYQQRHLLSSIYFDRLRSLLLAATEETPQFTCRPPPCSHSQGPKAGQNQSWASRTPVLLSLVPMLAVVVLLVWMVRSGRIRLSCSANHANAPDDVGADISSVSFSTPAADCVSPPDC
ncbi:uncharacterized protein LOC128758130 [Synchiropus splendidus]|uniref:uncharacterized protein LOC128758130 n=1 Tax=Synchiropus splendidus TaxID=270530 RepID=UPI00237D3FB0|nr:uncharacterized protein LOC128758130 [Synchiropus splendidus]